ncbi:hypothetical protein LSTR_LSTR017345 [Laodelphax striatellus]|uniref:VWFC domain-containing protein n=1 Tax=Laodelphax striatellus TaxID=195883 RepID=A0A482WWH6_LAOST|nr:hypothetical protein LSTR_LSTR017345 [Laodelphax striatellus]
MVTDADNLLDKNADKMVETTTTVQSDISSESSNSQPTTVSNPSEEQVHVDSEQASSQIEPESETIDLSAVPAEVTTGAQTEKIATEVPESASVAPEESDKEKGESLPGANEPESATSDKLPAEHDKIEMTTVINNSDGPHSVEIDEPEHSSEESMEEHDKDMVTPMSPVQGSEAPSHSTDTSAESEEHMTESAVKPEGGESDPVEQEEDVVVPEEETHKETEHSESGVESDGRVTEPVSSGTTNTPIETTPKTPEKDTSQTDSDLRATEEPAKESEVTEPPSTEKVETSETPGSNEPVISNSIPQDHVVEHDIVEHDDDVEETEAVHHEEIHHEEEDSMIPHVSEDANGTEKPSVDEAVPTTIQPTNAENESEPPKEVSSDVVEEVEQVSPSEEVNKIPVEQEATTIGASVDDVTHDSPVESNEHIPDSQTVGSSVHEEKTDRPAEDNEISLTNDQTPKPQLENDNGDSTTAQPTEKGSIPGEGSCLVDGVTYSDGADIPTTSPCHTECKCHSSIIKCKLMECPPPPSYLTNCIPVPQGEDSCCPVYSCDDKKKYPSLESQSQIGEMTTEHDDQRVEDNQSTEIGNEVPVATTEAAGGAGAEVAHDNTNSVPDEDQNSIPIVTSAPEKVPAQEAVVTEQVESANKPSAISPLVPQNAENDGVDSDEPVSATTDSSNAEHTGEINSPAPEEVKLENNEAVNNEETISESESPVVDQTTAKPQHELESSPDHESGSDITTSVIDISAQTTVRTETVSHDAMAGSDLPTPHDSEESVGHDDSQPENEHESNQEEATTLPEHQESSDVTSAGSSNAPAAEESTSKHEEYDMSEVTTIQPVAHDSVPQESMAVEGVSTEQVVSETESSDGLKIDVTESASSHPEMMEVTAEPIREMSVEYVQTTISSHIHHEVVDENKVEEPSAINTEEHTTEGQIHDVVQPNIPAILTGITDNVEKDGVSHYEDTDQFSNEDQTPAPETEHSENEKVDQIDSTTATVQQHNNDNKEEEQQQSVQQTTIQSDSQEVTTIPPSQPDSKPQQPETEHEIVPEAPIEETPEAVTSTNPPKVEQQDHNGEDEVKLTEEETESVHEAESSSVVNHVDEVVTEQQTTAPAEESSPETAHTSAEENKSEIQTTTTKIEDEEVVEHEDGAIYHTTEGSGTEQNLHDIIHNMLNPPSTHAPTEDVVKDEHTETAEATHGSEDSNEDSKKETTTEALQQEVSGIEHEEHEMPSSTIGELPGSVVEEEGIKHENAPDHIHEPESNTTPKEDIPEAQPEYESHSSTESPHVETTTAKLSSMVHHPESEVYTSSVDAFPHLPMNQWTQKPFQPEVTSEPPRAPEEDNFHPPSAGETDYEEEEESVYEPGACRFGGKIFISAQQVPRENPCDFCFCFRSDIICLQQSCPPPILGCREESIHGFCCPRYECPVSMATTFNFTTTTTTTTTTLPPHFLAHNYRGAARRGGCQVQNKFYRVGDEIPTASGPCLQCM